MNKQVCQSLRTISFKSYHSKKKLPFKLSSFSTLCCDNSWLLRILNIKILALQKITKNPKTTTKKKPQPKNTRQNTMHFFFKLQGRSRNLILHAMHWNPLCSERNSNMTLKQFNIKFTWWLSGLMIKAKRNRLKGKRKRVLTNL